MLTIKIISLLEEFVNNFFNFCAYLIFFIGYDILYRVILHKGVEVIVKESGEMYLESIYILCKSKANVRSIDIAEYMNYSKPSVCRAVGILKKDGYIAVDKDGYISLTNLGVDTANKIFQRHTVLTNLLIKLGIDKKTASEDACRIEHVISDTTFEAIKKYVE